VEKAQSRVFSSGGAAGPPDTLCVLAPAMKKAAGPLTRPLAAKFAAELKDSLNLSILYRRILNGFYYKSISGSPEIRL